MKYQKKPVVIEAFKYNMEARPDWFMDKVTDLTIITHGEYCLIKTLEGEMRAEIGDYIIKGIKGEVYPCKPDIFLLSYDQVLEPLKLPSGGITLPGSSLHTLGYR